MTLRQLGSAETIETAHFGAFCPYWTIQDGCVLLDDTAEEIILALLEKRSIVAPVAVMELLQFDYMLGSGNLV